MAVPQKTGDRSTKRSSYTTLRHIPKGYGIIPQEHLLNSIQNSFICNKNLETPRSPLPGNEQRKYGTFTVENYSALKNKNTRKSEGK